MTDSLERVQESAPFALYVTVFVFIVQFARIVTAEVTLLQYPVDELREHVPAVFLYPVRV